MEKDKSGKQIENSAPRYIPKHAQSIDDFDYDSQSIASATEMTGLTSTMPIDETEAKFLGDIYNVDVAPSGIVQDDDYTPKHKR